MMSGTSHYPCQCWPRSMSPYCFISLQWFKWNDSVFSKWNISPGKQQASVVVNQCILGNWAFGVCIIEMLSSSWLIWLSSIYPSWNGNQFYITMSLWRESTVICVFLQKPILKRKCDFSFVDSLNMLLNNQFANGLSCHNTQITFL